MKMYKGFDKDLKCRGFQYEIGKEYHEENADLCHSGFHACENPLDVFGYYHPRNGARFCEVELEDVSEEKASDDTKRCGKTIKIGAEINIADICKAHFEYVKSQCIPANSRAAGDHESASAGFKGSASAGECGSASAGKCGSASAGNWGSASAGECGSASAGKWGSASAGENGIACALNGRVKGAIGCAICTTEMDYDGNNIAVKAAIVDGEKIKADTWYKLENGEFVEA